MFMWQPICSLYFSVNFVGSVFVDILERQRKIIKYLYIPIHKTIKINVHKTMNIDVNKTMNNA